MAIFTAQDKYKRAVAFVDNYTKKMNDRDQALKTSAMAYDDTLLDTQARALQDRPLQQSQQQCQ